MVTKSTVKSKKAAPVTAKTSTTSKEESTKTTATPSESLALASTTSTTTPSESLALALASDLLYGFPVISREIADKKRITRKYNIRSLKNETANDAELTSSIRGSGVLNPVIVNTNYELLDGYRRLHVAINESSVENLPVIVVDVPDNKIALFQYLCGLEKGLTKEENINAIIKYATDNPEELDINIAKLFSVSHTTVSNATKILRKSPTIAELVANKKMSQRSALKVVETASKHKRNAEEIGQKVVSLLGKQGERAKNNDNQAENTIKAIHVVKALKEIFPSESLKANDSVSSPSAKKLLADLMFQLKPAGKTIGDKQEYTAMLDKNLVDQINQFLASKSTISGNGSAVTGSSVDEDAPKEYNLIQYSVKIPDDSNSTLLKCYINESYNHDTNTWLAYKGELLTFDENADYWETVLDDQAIPCATHEDSNVPTLSIGDVYLPSILKLCEEFKLAVTVVMVDIEETTKTTKKESKVSAKADKAKSEATAAPTAPTEEVIEVVDATVVTKDSTDSFNFDDILEATHVVTEDLTDIDIDDDDEINTDEDEDDEVIAGW